jgi:nitrile hydratase
LLDDANAAIGELGIDLSHWAPVKLRVVENTPRLHNLIVCTLCSCYPIALLGPSPSWYKSEAYRARAVRDPRGVLAEFGVSLPPDVRIAVWDSTAEARYMVLPQRPADTEKMSENELAALVTRNGLIGTALV